MKKMVFLIKNIKDFEDIKVQNEIKIDFMQRFNENWFEKKKVILLNYWLHLIYYDKIASKT